MKHWIAHLKSLHGLLQTGIKIELIVEPLFTVEFDASSSDVHKKLVSRNFDECGIRRNGVVNEFVRQEDLLTTESAGECSITVPPDRIVKPNEPLWNCITRIISSSPLYLTGDCGLKCIVTKADLNKQPARLLMFGVVSMLEMTLLALIRKYYTENSWQSRLSKSRIEKAKKLYKDRKCYEEDIDLEECLQFCDKAKICTDTDEIRESWAKSRRECTELFKKLRRIRDRLAHAQNPATNGNWADVEDALSEGRQILDRSVSILEEAE